MTCRRRPARKWRLRGRRGQVSAVATILGLLLVVTYLANYLTTTLPQQMSINDLNHDVQVQNQVGRLQALLEAASAADAVGGQFTQPITLGSSGAPPFAAADPGTIGPATNGSMFALTLPIAGPAYTYVAPTGGTPGGSTMPTTGVCVLTSAATVSLTCAGAGNGWYNFSSSPSAGFDFTFTNVGTYFLNVTTSGEPIALSSSNDASINLAVIGNNDTISVSTTNGGAINLFILGNYDTIQISNPGAPTLTATLYEVGLHDTTTLGTTTLSAKDITFLASIYGTTDAVSVTTTTGELNAETLVTVYFTGFNVSPLSTSCPNDNSVISDSVAGGSAPVTVHHVTTNYGTYAVTYNVTALPFTPTTAPPAFWTEAVTAISPLPANCPYFFQKATPMTLGETGAGFAVHLRNDYLPQSDVAFDEGGVVFAQSGGAPIMLDPPAFTPTISASTGALTGLSIWFPIFIGTFPVESGLSTAEISARLISLNTLIVVPTSQTLISTHADINITIVSPFAAAWMGYFNSTLPFENYNFVCTGPSAACNGPYATGGPVATVFLSIPTGTQLADFEMQIATFSVSLL